jgi:hypothetical protein
MVLMGIAAAFLGAKKWLAGRYAGRGLDFLFGLWARNEGLK